MILCSVGGETEAQGGRQGPANTRAHWAWARAEVQASDEAPSSAPTLHSAQIVSCLRERGVYKFGLILEQQSHKWTWLRNAGRYLTFQTGDGEGKGEQGGRPNHGSDSRIQGKIKLEKGASAEEGCRGSGQTRQIWSKCPLCSCLAMTLGKCLHLSEPPWSPNLVNDENTWKDCGKADNQGQPHLRENQSLPGWGPSTAFSRASWDGLHH